MTTVNHDGMASMQAVYRCFSAQGELLYVGVTGELGRRLADHAQKVWFPLVTGITLAWYPDRASAETAERLAIYIERPRYNVAGKGPQPQAGIPSPDVFGISGPPGLHPSRRRVIELLGTAGRLGATPGWLCERLKADGLEVTRQTLQKWLAEDVASRRVVKVSYGRYAAAHVPSEKSAARRAESDTFPGAPQTLVAGDSLVHWPAETQGDSDSGMTPEVTIRDGCGRQQATAEGRLW